MRGETMSYYKSVRVKNIQPDINASSGILGSLRNMNWKGWVDQLGGIDGIFHKMTQIQKIMQMVQQFSPMMKMLPSVFTRQNENKDQSDSFEHSHVRRPFRKKRRKKSASADRRKRRFL
jgi:hypothetical protein